MAARKPARKSASKMKSLSKKVSATEATSVRGGGGVAKSGASIVARQADESPKETVTFEYGGLSIRYGQQ
jgi:hypothetical protein